MLIDSHIHLPSTGTCKNDRENFFCDSFPNWQAAVQYEKNHGIDGAVFTTIEGAWADTEEELNHANEEVLEIWKSMPEYLYPGCSVHPAFPDCSLSWLKKFKELGLVWVGELVFYRQNRGPYDSDAWMKLFQACLDYGMIVQLHEHPSILNLAKNLPSLKIVHSHFGWNYQQELAKCSNVMLDLSGARGFMFGSYEKAAKNLGINRILWGSDFFCYDVSSAVARFRQSFFEPKEQNAVGAENVLSLIRSAGGFFL